MIDNACFPPVPNVSSSTHGNVVYDGLGAKAGTALIEIGTVFVAVSGPPTPTSPISFVVIVSVAAPV